MEILKIVFLFSVITSSVNGQEVISTQGDSYSNIHGSVEFTVGETVINTGEDRDNKITQGFHQTDWDLLNIKEYEPNFEATVFPNPVTNILNVNASEFENVSYSLYDSQGKLIRQDKLIQRTTPVEVGHLSVGYYSIELFKEQVDQNSSNKTKLKTFSLIKQY